MSERLRISYILPDFDERAHSGGLYVIFQHCNHLLKRGHLVRAWNNTGARSRFLPLDCELSLHYNDPARIEADAPHIIVATHWRTYYFFSRMHAILQHNTRLCMLVQSNDPSIVSDEERPLAVKSVVGQYAAGIPIYKIAVSRYLQDVLRDEYGQESVYVRNGVVIPGVQPLLEKSDRVRIVARYDPSTFRGWALADRVLSRIARERADVEIHLYEMKKRRPTAYPSIFHEALTGDGLARLFRSCDIYLAASRYEGFGYPIIEAMGQGCAVAATDAGGNREFCIDGETALLAGRDDEDTLYRNLVKLIADRELRGRISAAGAAMARGFRWDEGIDALEDFYRSVAGKPYGAGVVDTAAEQKPPAPLMKRALCVRAEDPLASYGGWLSLDTMVSHLANRGYRADAFLYIDRHTERSLRARMEMLAGPVLRAAVSYCILFNKKMPLRIAWLSHLAYYAKVLARLCRQGNDRYDVVFCTARESAVMKILCRVFRLRLAIYDPAPGALFTNSPKEFLQIEEAVRSRVGSAIDAALEA